MIVIGLDFGNYYTYPSFVAGMDEETRKGGIEHDLLQANRASQGIPSAYAPRAEGADLGYAAESRPATEVVRLLKRKLGADEATASVELQVGKERITVDVDVEAALTELAQYCVRQANQVLRQDHIVQDDIEQSSNQVALAYPVTFNPLQVRKLINCVEAATLEDGRHVKVIGTVAEPAAAALDFLAKHEDVWTGKGTTILVYDLGAGTFDASLVTCYPMGKRDDYGNLMYYEVHDKNGIADIGGEQFRELVMKMIGEQIGGLPTRGPLRAEIEREAERAKIDLTDSEDAAIYITNPQTWEYYDISITRSDFEDRSKELLRSTIDCVQTLLNRHADARPTYIVLTGGASQMPMVEREVTRAFGPNTAIGAQVVAWRPSRAISYGTARYHLPYDGDIPPLIQRVQWDIGVRYYQRDTDRLRITTFIHRGTQLPFGDDANHSSHYIPSETRSEGVTESVYAVYIAKVVDPDRYAIDHDWEYIGELKLKYGRPVPAGTASMTRIVIDRLGTLQADAYMEDDHAVMAAVTLEYRGGGRALLG